jgi:chemotaxis response regulator CheB
MAHKISTSHRKAFLQTWLGLWRKYTADILLSSHRRTYNSLLDTEMKALLNNLDFSLSAAAQRIRQLDKETYNRMRVSHHHIARKAIEAASKASNEKHNAWFAADPDRKRTSSYRNRGLGTMLAILVSTGGGTNLHYDKGDDGKLPI